MFPIKGSHSYFIVPKIYFGFSFIMTIYLLGMYWNHILLFDLLILRIALLYVYLLFYDFSSAYFSIESSAFSLSINKSFYIIEIKSLLYEF